MCRNEEIYELKKQGHTNAEIGAMFGLCKQRVTQICKAEQEKELIKTSELYKCFENNISVLRALSRNGVNTKKELKEAVENNAIWEMRRIGKKSISVIYDVYDEYIEFKA